MWESGCLLPKFRVLVLRFWVWFSFNLQERQCYVEFLILLLEFEVSHHCFCNCWALGSCPQEVRVGRSSFQMSYCSGGTLWWLLYL